MTYIRRSPVWPDPRLKPPYGAAELDHAHAMARGLAGYWLMNEGGGALLDSVQANHCFPVAGTNPVYHDGRGILATGVNSQNSRHYVSAAGVTGLPTVGPLTIVYRAAPGESQFDENGVCAYGATDNSRGWWATIKVGSTSASFKLVFVGIQSCESTSEYPVNVPVTVGGRRMGAGVANWQIVVNGYSDGAVNTDPPNAPLSSDTFRIVYYAVGLRPSYYFNGTLTYLAIFNLALTNDEIARFHAEPYALFRPVIRRRWFVPAATGYAGPFPTHRRA